MTAIEEDEEDEAPPLVDALRGEVVLHRVKRHYFETNYKYEYANVAFRYHQLKKINQPKSRGLTDPRAATLRRRKSKCSSKELASVIPTRHPL